MAPQTQVRRIIVKYDTQGDKDLKKITSSLASMNKEVKRSSDIMKSFQNAFTSIAGVSFLGFGIGEVTNLLDSMQKLNDRLTNTEGSAEKATQTLGKLKDIANLTNSSVTDLATVYTRLNLALGDTGISTDGLLGLTLALQNSFRVSGSTASEATASVIQLSQGLASGQLRGQELRSVLEQNAVVGEILAKQLNITRGQLLKFAEKEGGIKAKDFLLALANNFERLNEKASNLTPTIREGLTKALNDFQFNLNEANKEFGITEKIVAGIGFAFDNLGKAVGIASIAIIYFKREAIGAAFLSGLAALQGLLFSVGTAITIFVASIGAIPIAIGAAVVGIGALVIKMTDFDKVIGDLKQTLPSFVQKDLNAFADILEKIGLTSAGDAIRDFTRSVKETQSTSDLKGTFIQRLPEILDFTNQELIEGKKYVSIYGEALRYAAENIKSPAKEAISLKKQLEILNTAFTEGKIDVLSYNTGVIKLTELISAKKGPTFQFEALSKAMREGINREFEYGVINVEEFNRKIREFEIDQLEQKFVRGRISLEEYNKELTEMGDKFRPESAFYTGTQNFLNSIGTVSQNVAGLVENTFSRLEDSLLDFIETGKFNFKEFSLAIIQDINRIILRALIIRPLAEGVLGAIGGAGASAGAGAGGAGGGSSVNNTMSANFQANGGGWNKGVQFYADGGVFNKPTMFSHSGGLGVLGEAGPEAVMPLTRNSNGKLGVEAKASPVIVNIINNTGAEVSQSETTGPNGIRMLEVLITSKVKEGLASGSYDRTMQQAYGLRRKGS